MSTWHVTYVIPVLGDSPLTRRITVDIDTEGLDVYGKDEQAVLDRLRAKVGEHGGQHAVLTDATQAN